MAREAARPEYGMWIGAAGLWDGAARARMAWLWRPVAGGAAGCELGPGRAVGGAL